MSTATLYTERPPNLLLRALWFVLLGLWLSSIWAAVAWVLCVTVLGLPFGLWMLNRLPLVTTLTPARREWLVSERGRLVEHGPRQHPLLVRALWFFLVGWWASAIWLALAWALCATWIGLPFGFWMFNRVPAIITLAQR
jgi:uncharacterized membrane protein YccF (DUF307 family)